MPEPHEFVYRMEHIESPKGSYFLGTAVLNEEEWRQALVCAALVARLGGETTIPLDEIVRLQPRILSVAEDIMNQSLILKVHP